MPGGDGAKSDGNVLLAMLTSLDVGSATLGTTSESTLTISNNGTGTLRDFSGSAIQFEGAFEFKGNAFPGTGGTCGATLAGGASCTLLVTYKPVATGEATGKMTLNYRNALGEPVTMEVALSGRVWWRAVSTVNRPSGRRMHASAYTGDTGVVSSQKKLLVFGGETALGVVTNTGYVYDIAGDSWAAMTSTNAPSARAWSANYFSPVWTGNTGDPATQHRLLVWGGTDRNGANRGDGAIYHPESDTWTPMNPTGAPGPVDNPVLVFAGGANADVYIWGGYGPTNQGAIYSIKNDSWTPITTTGAPSARHQHMVVWTGDTGNASTQNRLIVWGGWPDTQSGGIYNPATDGWLATSTTNAPSPRRWHNGVWTGNTGNPTTSNKMVVWGGYFNGTVHNNGGIYDPNTDTWSPISAPAGKNYGRYDYHPTFDGRRVKFFMGANYGTPGIQYYDLETSTWSEFAGAAGDPNLFRYQALQWVPQGIMIWGGSTTGNDFADYGMLYLGPTQ